MRAADADAVTVLAHVLGGGESARLEREVRAKKGLVLGAGAWFDETKDPGLVGVSFVTEPGKEVAALAAVAEEVARLREVEVPAAEIERVKTAIRTHELFANESYHAQANRLCWYAVIGDPKLGADREERIAAVTAGEVREAARRYLRAGGATVAVVVPEGVTGTGSGSGSGSDSGSGAGSGTGSGSGSDTGTGTMVAELIAALMGVEAAAPGAVAEARARTVARRIAGGTMVIAREDRSAPIVAATVRYADPFEAEPAGKRGVAALAERLLTRGARVGEREVSRAGFADRIDGLGIHLATGLDLDALTGTLEAPAERFEAGLELLASALRRPTFDPAEIEKARAEQVAAIEAIDDDSFALVGREFYASLYGDAPYGEPVDGTVEGVKAAACADLATWHRTATDPRQAVIAIVGAIEPEAAIAAVEARFGAADRGDGSPGAPAAETGAVSGPAGANPGKNSSVSPASLSDTTLTAQPTPHGDITPPRLLDRPREQVCFRIGHVGIAPTDPDWVPLAIAVRHLASQVFFRYVYENGMAYRAWTYLRGGRRAHPFTFEMGVSAPNFKTAREGLTAALGDLVGKGLSADEVAKAKADLVSRHLLGQQTDAAQASLLAHYESIGVGWRRLDDLPDLVARASVDDVNRALRKNLRPDRLAIAVVGDLRAAGLR